jgi:hypothetical protein
MSTYNISFVDLLMFLFDVFWGMCGENSCKVFLLLFIVLWVFIFATPCKRTMLMLWHALMFLGLRFFLASCLVVSTAFSCKNIEFRGGIPSRSDGIEFPPKQYSAEFLSAAIE